MICGNPHCGHLAIRHSQHGCICGCPISHLGLWLAVRGATLYTGRDQLNRLTQPAAIVALSFWVTLVAGFAWGLAVL
jgi:hypothetical protein